MVAANLVWVDKRPPTAPSLMPAGDTFCSLLFDHPGHSAKLGTLSFTSTANNLRNTLEAEQSTNLYDNKRRLNMLGSYNPVQSCNNLPYFSSSPSAVHPSSVPPHPFLSPSPCPLPTPPLPSPVPTPTLLPSPYHPPLPPSPI